MEELQRCGYNTYFDLNRRGVVLYINDALSSSEMESTSGDPAVWCRVSVAAILTGTHVLVHVAHYLRCCLSPAGCH